MFCTSCGKQIVAGAAFCQNCGSRVGQPGTPPLAPVYPAPPPPPPPRPAPPATGQPSYGAPVPGAEDVLLTLRMERKLSLANSVICNVVFKRQWLVLAHLTKQLLQAENAKLQAQGVGVFKRSAAQMRLWSDSGKRYLSMTTDAVLAEDPTNRVICYDTISSVEFKCAHETTDEDGYSNGMGKSHFVLVTGGETLKFTHQEANSRELQNALTGLFGPKLIYKR